MMVSGGRFTCFKKSRPEIFGMLISRYIKSTPGKCLTASAALSRAATQKSESTSEMYSIRPLRAKGSSSITMQFIFGLSIIHFYIYTDAEFFLIVFDLKRVLVAIQEVQPSFHIS